MPSKEQARIRLLDEVAGGHRCTQMKERNRGGLSRREGNSFPFSKQRIKAEIVCTQAGDEQLSGKQRCKLANVEGDAGRVKSLTAAASVADPMFGSGPRVRGVSYVFRITASSFALCRGAANRG